MIQIHCLKSSGRPKLKFRVLIESDTESETLAEIIAETETKADFTSFRLLLLTQITSRWAFLMKMECISLLYRSILFSKNAEMIKNVP